MRWFDSMTDSTDTNLSKFGVDLKDKPRVLHSLWWKWTAPSDEQQQHMSVILLMLSISFADFPVKFFLFLSLTP